MAHYQLVIDLCQKYSSME